MPPYCRLFGALNAWFDYNGSVPKSSGSLMAGRLRDVAKYQALTLVVMLCIDHFVLLRLRCRQCPHSVFPLDDLNVLILTTHEVLHCHRRHEAWQQVPSAAQDRGTDFITSLPRPSVDSAASLPPQARAMLSNDSTFDH